MIRVANPERPKIDPCDRGRLYAGHPLKYLTIGGSALLGGWILLRLRRNGAREWAQLAGKLALLAFSVVLALAAGEIGLRAYLLMKLEANSIDFFNNIGDADTVGINHDDHG